MKRPLLIILGIIIVLILVGIWVYVLLTGSPNNTQQFNTFGFGDTTDQAVNLFTDDDTNDAAPVVNMNAQEALRQLTTEPVAGFAVVQPDASSTPRIHYVQAGTGHIFSIDLETGTEERVSATTIPLANAAVLTNDGRHVLMQTGEGLEREYIVGTLASSSDELRNFAISNSITSFAVSNLGEFLFTIPQGNTTVAVAYDPVTNTDRVLFTVPFRDLTIDWNESVAGPHLVYPRTASRLESFVYSYTDGVATRLPVDGYGLSAAGEDTSVLYSQVLNTGDYVTNTYNLNTGVFTTLPFPIIPEKCAISATTEADRLYCGVSLVEYSIFMPDPWYQGDLVLADGLWEVFPETSSMTQLVDITDQTGRTVDVINLEYYDTTGLLLFQNKLDGTLWLYDLTQ